MLDGLFFGTATQREAARRRRPRGAVREQEDEDAQGHGAWSPRRREGAAPRGSSGSLFGKLRQSQARCVIGHRAGCAAVPQVEAYDRARRGLREVEWVRSAATARGSKSGGAQRKGLPPDKRPRPHTHHTHASRSGGLVTSGTQRRGPDRPPIPWVSPVMKLGTSRPKSASEKLFSCLTRTGRVVWYKKK